MVERTRKSKRTGPRPPTKARGAAKVARSPGDMDLESWLSADAITGVAWLIRETHRAVVRRVDAELEPYEVDSNMWRMMRAMRIAGRPVSQFELLEHSGLNQSSTSAKLTTLIQLGMITSAPGETDRRHVQYQLTDKGRGVEEALNTIALKVVLLGTHGLGERQLQSLRKMLSFIRDNLARHPALEEVPDEVFAHATRPVALPKKKRA